MTQMFFDLFPAHFEVLQETAMFAGPRYTFGDRRRGIGVLDVVLSTGGMEWLGEFPIELRPPAMTSLLATPSPDRCLIVSGGRGYLFDANRPEHFETLPVFPILQAYARAPAALFLLDYTSVCMVGEDGVRWTSKRLSDDGLEVETVSDVFVTVVGWDASQHTTVRWRVHCKDGTATNIL